MMINQWIKNKVEPLKEESVIILKDPQRMIEPGDFALDDWAKTNGFTMLMCTGNLALRAWYENFRDDPEVKLLLVDRSRVYPKRPHLFYPDIQARASQQAQITLSLRAYLIETTGDEHWPRLVDENRQIAAVILDHLAGIQQAHSYLRDVSANRFSDGDFYKIVFGAVLDINPFEKLTPKQVRRLCIEQYPDFKDLEAVLSIEVMDSFREMIHKADYPFNKLLDQNPMIVMQAVNLAALLHQHGLDYHLLLGNFDPSLMMYRDIKEDVLEAAVKDLVESNPTQVSKDMHELANFLEESLERVELLFVQQLKVEDPDRAFEVLKNEKLSEFVRRMALFCLLIDLFQKKPKLKFHAKVLQTLKEQEQDKSFLALRRPSGDWQSLMELYEQTIEYFGLLVKLAETITDVKLKPDDDLSFEEFDKYWNKDQLNRLEYYGDKVNRQMRIGAPPMKKANMWQGLKDRWEGARDYLKNLNQKGDYTLSALDARFQDLYQKHYTKWIEDQQSPAIFTHQFLDRIFRKYWNPKEDKKAVIMVFDGMRTDAWDIFLKPVFETRFNLEAVFPGSAILPTETNLSRKAISAGSLPTEFNQQRSKRESDLFEHWLEKQLNTRIKFEIKKDEDTDASGMTVWYQSEKLDYIVFNFTDSNLHHNNSELSFIYENTVQQIIREDVQAVLRDIPDDALIFITSDHGFTTMPNGKLRVPETVASSFDVKYRCARAQNRFEGHEDDVVTFLADQMHIPKNSADNNLSDFRYVHFPRPHILFENPVRQHSPDKYSHGGLTMAECLIPMIVMTGKPKQQDLFHIAGVSQVNTAGEKEPVELEIEVRSSKMFVEDTLLTFSFNVSNLPPRREYIKTPYKTVRVSWIPELPEITGEHKQKGLIRLPLLVRMSYLDNGKEQFSAFSTEVEVRVDPDKLRRKIDSKLDLMMGKIPTKYTS